MVLTLMLDLALAPAPVPAWDWTPTTQARILLPDRPAPLAAMRTPEGLLPVNAKWHALAPETQRTLDNLRAYFALEDKLWSWRGGQDLAFIDDQGRVWPIAWSRLEWRVLAQVNWALISMAVLTWHFGLLNLRTRPQDPIMRVYVLGGLAYAASLLIRAWVAARPWAISGEAMEAVFRASHLMGHALLGGCLFVALRLPRQLLPRSVERLVMGSVITLAVIDQFHPTPDMLFMTYQYPVMVMALTVVGTELWLWHRLRRDPTYRAALRWLFMAFALSAGPGTVFYGLWATGLLSSGISNSANLMAPALAYYGISALLHRDQLFRLENLRSGALAWWIALLTALAVLFVLSQYGQTLTGWGPLAALFTLPWAYLAARLWLHRQAPLTAAERLEQLVPQLMTLAAQEGSLHAHQQAWERLLRSAFDPGQLLTCPTADVPRVAIDHGGLSLSIPALTPRDSQDTTSLPAVVLHAAQQGARLFNPTDAQLAETLQRLASQGAMAQHSYTEGAHAERRRIAADLHDDIGGKLLHLSQTAADQRLRHYALNTLSDLRNITRGLSAQHRSWADALADLRHQLTRRLEPIDVTLDWQMHWPATLMAQAAPAEVSVSLSCVASELVRNAIEHAQATELQLRWQHLDGELDLSLRHKGQVRDPLTWRPGLGVQSIRRRVAELQGQCHWHLDGDELIFEARWPVQGMVTQFPKAAAPSRELGMGN